MKDSGRIVLMRMKSVKLVDAKLIARNKVTDRVYMNIRVEETVCVWTGVLNVVETGCG